MISAYAPCVDIMNIVTPDFKCPKGSGKLLYVRFASSIAQNRLGGTALAQCLGQLGGVPPDLDSAEQFSNAFAITQSFIESNCNNNLDGGSRSVRNERRKRLKSLKMHSAVKVVKVVLAS